MKITFDGSTDDWVFLFGGKGTGGVPVLPQEAEEPDVEFSVNAETPKWKLEMPNSRAVEREGASLAFSEALKEWLKGFEDPDAPQPDRLGIVKGLGSSRWSLPILVMAYEVESLQGLVAAAMAAQGDPRATDLDFVHRVAGNMVQVSHKGFPDLAGTFDHSTRWRRTA